MKICICSINSQYIHSSLAPWCLLAGLEAYGHETFLATVVEGTVNEPANRVLERVVAQAPQVVGFCCYIWNIERVKELIPAVKAALPKAVIVLGGPEVGYCARQIMEEEPLVDYVITGQGEQSFALLCRELMSNQPIHLPGITLRQGREIVSFPEAPLLQEPPSPYSPAYFSALKGRIAYLETSRGCPYACAYCLSARCGKLQFFSLDRAKSEMLALAASGAKTIKLVDRTFNANRSRALELWRFIIENYGTRIPQGVCFHFEIAGDLLDAQALALLKTAPAGSMQFEVGIQSFYEPTLAYIKRKTDLTRLTNHLRELISAGNVHVHVDLIAGLPLEDYEQFSKSVNSAFALQPQMLQLGFLKLIPGSPMREDPDRYPCRFHTKAPYEVIDTPVLSRKELEQLHLVEWGLDRLYNSGRFPRSLAYLLETGDLSPFDLFLRFGQQYGHKKGAALSEIAANLFALGKELGLPADVFRDLLVCDWLTCVKGGTLPDFLQKADPALAVFRKQLRKSPQTAPKAGVPRGTAILYASKVGVYVDYESAHPVTGQYPLHTVAI